METKKPWQSKTVVINAIMAVLGVVVVFVPEAAVAKTFAEAHVGEFGIIWGIANIVVRMITKDAVTLGD